jgi:TRAP-type C4-dicarboxylate transport system permease small subunit
MHKMARVASTIFGVLLVLLSLLVTLDTLLRKFAGISLQGTDELGGYVLAVGSCLAFTVALVDRAHIRIDLLQGRLPAGAQAILNLLSAATTAALALILVRFAWNVLDDTVSYGSTAPTPWATPLIYPQALWFAGLVLFAASAVWLTVRGVLLAGRGEIGGINRELGPLTALEELEEELSDLKRR